jgi:hypothetical protein
MDVDYLYKACRALNIRPDPLGYIADAQAGALMRRSKRTMCEFRRRGDGPAYIMLGGRVRYSLAAIAAYYTALERQAEQNDAERTATRLARRQK